MAVGESTVEQYSSVARVPMSTRRFAAPTMIVQANAPNSTGLFRVLPLVHGHAGPETESTEDDDKSAGDGCPGNVAFDDCECHAPDAHQAHSSRMQRIHAPERHGAKLGGEPRVGKLACDPVHVRLALVVSWT